MSSPSVAPESGFRFLKLKADLSSLNNPGYYIQLSEFVTGPRLSLISTMNQTAELLSYLRTELYQQGYVTETVNYNSADFQRIIERIQKIFKSERATRYKKYKVILDLTGVQNSEDLPNVETVLSGIEDSLEFRGKNEFGAIMVASHGFVSTTVAGYSPGYEWFDTMLEGYWPPYVALKLKSNGDPVREIQNVLAKMKRFKGVVDGMFGKQTSEAVLQFQAECDLPPTGEVDEETYYQIMMAAKAGVSAKPKAKKTSNNINSEVKFASKFENAPDGIMEPGYWILKLKTPTWNIEELQDGTKCWFNCHKEKQKRPEYNLFEKVKPGDRMIGYAQGINNGVVGTFKVTEGIHEDPSQGEIISFDAEDILETPVHFRDKELRFHDELTGDSELRLFEISKDIYEEILSPAPEQEHPLNVNGTNRTTLPFFYTEGNHGNKDQLDFENDIGSLAAVMSLANVKPPLAIGLFGKWGSGKSFFMEKLYERVNECADSKKPEFVRNVVQVKFNSWHYADTNLWACMVTEIFDSLNKYSTNKKNLDELKRLKNTLDFTSKQKEAAEVRKSQLESRVSDMELEKQNKHEKLEDLTAWDLLKLVISDKTVSDDGKQLLKNKNVEEILGNANDLKASMNELHSFWSKLIASWKMLKKMKGWRWVYGLGIMIIVGLGSLLLTRFFRNEYEQLLARIAAVTTAAVTFVGYFMQFFKPVKQKFEHGYERLKSFHDTIENRPQKLSSELIANRNEMIELKNSIASLNATQQSTQREIREIVEGKRLFDFIEQRMSDEHYSQQLGMMSWIRRDFNRLDELLRLQHQHQDPKSKEVYNPENVKLQIDRIILYIDDLDRCNEDIVVKVLEAIHLLLAFPLFVVVVGVDPRWLNNAINEKYKSLFGATNHKPSLENELNETALDGAATSYDYLEKIFQIPFCLKPITKTGREKLIGYLLKEEMAEDKQTSNEKQKFESAESNNGKEESASAEGKNNNDKTAAGKLIEERNTNTPTPVVKINSEQISTAITTDTKTGSISHAQEPEQNHEEEERKKKQMAEITQKLTFTDDELEFMKKISPVFGSSPRTINRFINIYRIIKSHKSLVVSEEFSRDDYGPILILLSVVVGFSAIAQPFIEKLNGAKGDQAFKAFLEVKDVDSEIKKALQKYADADLLQFTNKIYQNNIELISRFSFRTLID